MIIIGGKKKEKEEEREKNEVREAKARRSLDNFVVWDERLNLRPRS